MSEKVTVRELSERLGISVNTLQARIHRTNVKPIGRVQRDGNRGAPAYQWDLDQLRDADCLVEFGTRKQKLTASGSIPASLDSIEDPAPLRDVAKALGIDVGTLKARVLRLEVPSVGTLPSLRRDGSGRRTRLYSHSDLEAYGCLAALNTHPRRVVENRSELESQAGCRLVTIEEAGDMAGVFASTMDARIRRAGINPYLSGGKTSLSLFRLPELEENDLFRSHYWFNTVDRFWEKVGPSLSGGCRPWLGAINKDGYGTFNTSSPKGAQRALLAHIFSWEIHNALEVPEGHSLHHDCLNEWCVEPTHCRPLTHDEHREVQKKIRRESKILWQKVNGYTVK